jgi:cell division protease FtsH
VAHILPHPDPIRKVSIISRGQAAGYTLKFPEIEKHFHSRAEFLDELAVLLAGFVAEKEIFGDVTTGATSDLRAATQLARKLVTEYGMSEKLGPMTFGQKEELIFLGREIAEQKDYSEKVAAKIDKEVSVLINRAQKTAQSIISKHKNKLNSLAEALIKKETVERKELERILGKKKKLK